MGLLFHVCRTCIFKVLEITAAANSTSVHEILNSTCYFINLQWLFRLEENCLDRIHFELNGRIGIKYEGILGNVCAQCQTKLCLKIIHEI